MVEHASASHLIRAYQRDEEYKTWLRYSVLESCELFFKARWISRWRGELTLCSDLLYYAMTTLQNKTTLGEQYCGISPVDARGGQFPHPTKLWTFVGLNVLGPYVVSKQVKSFEPQLQ